MPRPSDVKVIRGGIRKVIDGVLEGRVEKGAGSVAFQGYNARIDKVGDKVPGGMPKSDKELLEALDREVLAGAFELFGVEAEELSPEGQG